MRPVKYSASKWGIWMLEIIIGIDGVYSSWNACLATGLSSYLVAYLMVAGVYITLCMLLRKCGHRCAPARWWSVRPLETHTGI